MSKINGSEPAFPNENADDKGLTIREHFAANASDSMIKHFIDKYLIAAETNEPKTWGIEGMPWSQYHMEQIAFIVARYRVAESDALIAELNKSN